jgi:hypothetical protein
MPFCYCDFLGFELEKQIAVQKIRNLLVESEFTFDNVEVEKEDRNGHFFLCSSLSQ